MARDADVDIVDDRACIPTSLLFLLMTTKGDIGVSLATNGPRMVFCRDAELEDKMRIRLECLQTALMIRPWPAASPHMSLLALWPVPHILHHDEHGQTQSLQDSRHHLFRWTFQTKATIEIPAIRSMIGLLITKRQLTQG